MIFLFRFNNCEKRKRQPPLTLYASKGLYFLIIIFYGAVKVYVSGFEV